MVCLTLGFVLNAFELKRFESLPAAKSFTKTSTSLVLPLQSLRQSWRFSRFSMLGVVMVLDPSDNIPTPSLNKKPGPESRVNFGQQNSCCFSKLTKKSISNTVVNHRVALFCRFQSVCQCYFYHKQASVFNRPLN